MAYSTPTPRSKAALAYTHELSFYHIYQGSIFIDTPYKNLHLDIYNDNKLCVWYSLNAQIQNQIRSYKMITVSNEFGIKLFTTTCYKHQIIESNVLNNNNFCYSYLSCLKLVDKFYSESSM